MADYAGVIKLGVKVDDSGLNAQVEKAGSHAGASFTNALKGAFSFAVGQNVFDFISNGFRDTISSAFNFDSTMQSATTSFTTLLHSATQASSLVSQLNAIDQVSTLDMTDLSKAAQEMISFGVSSADVVPTIKELGDISQGNSAKFGALALAFSQTASAGRLTGQDLLQYISAGFNPLQIIAQKTGKSMSELREEMGKGQISAADVADAFKTATSAGGSFYNATSNASKTYSGQMAMLQASTSETLGAMIKPSFNNIANNVLPHFNSAMGVVSSTFNSTHSVIQSVSAGLTSAFGPAVGNTFKVLATDVKDVFGWIIEHKTAIISSIVGIGGAFAAFKTINVLSKAKNAFTDIKAGMDIIASPKKAINDVTGSFQKLGAGFQLLKNAATNGGGLKGISKDFTELFHVPPQALIVIGIVGAIAALAVVVIKNWGPISSFFTKTWASVSSATRGAWMPIQNTITAAWNIIKPTIIAGLQTVQQWWNKIWPQLKQIFSDVWNVIKAILAPIIAVLYTEIQTWLGLIQGVWSSVWQLIKDVFIGVWNVIADVVKTAWGVVSNTIKLGLDLITGLFNIFRDILTGNWGRLWNDLTSLGQNAWHDITGIFGSLFGGLGNIFRDIGSAALNWGRDIISGIINGIKGAIGGLKNAVSNVGNVIKSFLHFSEPDVGPLVGFHTWPKDMMSGLSQDILENKGLVTSAMQSVTSGMAVAIHPTAMMGLASNKSGGKAQTIDQSVTKAPVVHIHGDVNFADAGSKRANMQQLDILAGF